MVHEIEAAFPRLRAGNYQVTSPREDAYNCVAWAAGHTEDIEHAQHDLEGTAYGSVVLILKRPVPRV